MPWVRQDPRLPPLRGVVMDALMHLFHNDHGELTALLAGLAALPLIPAYLRALWVQWTCPDDCPVRHAEHNHGHETSETHRTTERT